jgi:hypothetical protein
VPSIAASSDSSSKPKAKSGAKITHQVPPASPPPAEDLQVPAEAS